MQQNHDSALVLPSIQKEGLQSAGQTEQDTQKEEVKFFYHVMTGAAVLDIRLPALGEENPKRRMSGGFSTNPCSNSGRGDFLWPLWRRGLSFQKIMANDEGYKLSSMGSSVDPVCFWRLSEVQARPGLPGYTKFHCSVWPKHSCVQS